MCIVERADIINVQTHAHTTHNENFSKSSHSSPPVHEPALPSIYHNTPPIRLKGATPTRLPLMLTPPPSHQSPAGATPSAHHPSVMRRRFSAGAMPSACCPSTTPLSHPVDTMPGVHLQQARHPWTTTVIPSHPMGPSAHPNVPPSCTPAKKKAKLVPLPTYSYY